MKYVQHSERLEKDRKGVIEAISSCDVGDIVGDSMVEMVASLCDKLVSIEEECDALASSEGKAAEYLRELDSLRERYSALERQAQSYGESKANLKNAQEKISALMREKESLQTMAANTKKNMSELQSERRRQMQYLENENLQLGDDLKKTKKALTETKAELDSVQKNAFGSEETVELQGLSNFLGPSRTHRTSESASKRPPLMSGSKRTGSSKKRSSDSPGTKEDGTEKENLLNKKRRTLTSSIRSPFGSAKKKRSNSPFSSVKKAARRTRKSLADDSPTKKEYVLGDSEPTEDVTSECNQS